MTFIYNEVIAICRGIPTAKDWATVTQQLLRAPIYKTHRGWLIATTLASIAAARQQLHLIPANILPTLFRKGPAGEANELHELMGNEAITQIKKLRQAGETKGYPTPLPDTVPYHLLDGKAYLRGITRGTTCLFDQQTLDEYAFESKKQIWYENGSAMITNIDRGFSNSTAISTFDVPRLAPNYPQICEAYQRWEAKNHSQVPLFEELLTELARVYLQQKISTRGTSANKQVHPTTSAHKAESLHR